MSPRRKTALSMEHVLLALLAREPMHGYELHRRLNEMPGIAQVWNLKQALLYAKLELLEAEGDIQVKATRREFTPPRKVYAVTQQGQKKLEAWIREPVYRARLMQQVFNAKLLCAWMQSPQLALDLIEKQREVMLNWHSRLVDEEARLDPKAQFGDWVVLSFKDKRDQGTLGWLDSVQAQIEGMQEN